MRRRWTQAAWVILFLAVLTAWASLLFLVSPDEIVNRIGPGNGYVAVFVLSLFGGLSTFFSGPNHLALMTFAAGGLNPLLLGVTAAVGQNIGDSTTYLLGRAGGHLAPQKLHRLTEYIAAWMNGRPYWQVFAAVFAYASLCPLSNDFILIPLGMAEYPYRRIMIPLTLGSVAFKTGVAFLGAYGLASVLE